MFKNFIKNNLLAMVILVAAALISIAVYSSFSLDMLQKIFSIIGSFSLGIALAAYLYNKNKDKTMAAIEQVSFIRTEIIPKWSDLSKIIRKKNPRFMFSRIMLDVLTLEFMEKQKKYSRNFHDQLSIFLNSPGTSLELLDSQILDQQIFLFNMLEEFALRVMHFKTIQHPALDSVRDLFVEVIEKNAVALIFIREVIVGRPIYSTALELYNFWKNDADRTHIIERLKKYGFINPEEKNK